MNNYDEHGNIILEEGQTQIPGTKLPVGKWHYVKVFCTFFSLIASFGCFCFATELRSDFWGLLALMWGIGVISALMVAPGKFFKFGWGVICACATFGWFLLPFPLDLITVALSASVGVVVALLALVAVPAIFTVYTYITDIRYECEDVKKEIIAGAAGVGAVLVCIALFMGMTAISKAIEAPEMEKKFNVVEIYEEYRKNNTDANEYSADVLSNPLDTTKMDDGYIRVNTYEFIQKEGKLDFRYHVDMEFEYIDDNWQITDIHEDKKALGFEAFSGTWTGKGEYPANLSAGNQYVCTFSINNDNSGTGTLDVTHDGWEGEHMSFSIQVGEFAISDSMSWGEEYGNIVYLTFVLDEPVSYEFFGVSNTYNEVKCIYSFDADALVLDTFDYGLVLN